MHEQKDGICYGIDIWNKYIYTYIFIQFEVVLNCFFIFDFSCILLKNKAA